MKATNTKIAGLLLAGLLILPGCDLVGEEAGTGTGGPNSNAGASSTELAPIRVVSEGESVYFKETDRTLGQPFLRFWEEHGGVAVFGYPISERIEETDEATGEKYGAKYFERARMELHEETGEQVVLGRLGAILRHAEPPAQPLAGAQFFPETGHNLSGPFLTFWNGHGGLAIFGYPITEMALERNPVDGKEYTVQYFERSRFELHPELAGTPYEVQLGQLGKELFEQKYGKR
jgi:hypothetical protein